MIRLVGDTLNVCILLQIFLLRVKKVLPVYQKREAWLPKSPSAFQKTINKHFLKEKQLKISGKKKKKHQECKNHNETLGIAPNWPSDVK